MADDKQTTKPEDQTKKSDELNAEDLDKVSGGVKQQTDHLIPNKVTIK